MSSAVETVVADLRAIFALRLNAVVVYGRHAVGARAGGAASHAGACDRAGHGRSRGLRAACAKLAEERHRRAAHRRKRRVRAGA